MRTSNSIKNILVSFLGQFLGIIISLISRLAFVRILSSEYLGLSGLFTNILTILSLTELGFSTAMSYQLYKPLAENDEKRIKGLMKFYKKIYTVIGIVIIVLGIITIPIYPYFLNEIPQIKNLDLIYILFVLNTACSYFYSYKRLLITADQKYYIVTIYKYLFYFILNFLQIVELIIFKNYIIYLIIQIIITILENICISIHANKIYPFLKEKNNSKLSTESKKDIFSNVKSMFLHKFGGVVLNSTDNIVISKILGLSYVGLYSNYTLITNSLTKIINQIFRSLVASVGNLDVTCDKNKKTDVFNKIFFLDFWIHVICSVCIICFFNDFIKLWLGQNYVLSQSTVIIIAIYFYIYGMRLTAMSFREATGNYHEDRFSPVIEAIINIVASIILAKYMGIAGVVLGTIISSLCTNFWCEPLVITKRSLNINIFQYFKIYFKYTVIGLIMSILVGFVSKFITVSNFCMLIIKFILIFALSNLILIIAFRKNKYFQFYTELSKKIIFRKEKKK